MINILNKYLIKYNKIYMINNIYKYFRKHFQMRRTQFHYKKIKQSFNACTLIFRSVLKCQSVYGKLTTVVTRVVATHERLQEM